MITQIAKSSWLVVLRAVSPTRTRRRSAPPLQVEPLEERKLLSSGSWRELANPAPAQIGTMLLLSDGTVMAQGGGGRQVSNSWYGLMPNTKGSYTDGVWTTLASMHTARLFYASDVLPNGDVFLAGGEYTDAGKVRTNTSEMYDPITYKWSPITSFPQSVLGDAPSEALPNGQVLVGYIGGPQTYIYNPAINRWTLAANLQGGDESREESWGKLPDGSILSYSITASIHTGVSQAQRYVPALREWVTAGIVPVPLSSNAVGSEIGPAFLLPSGRVFFLGGNSNTALYQPSTSKMDSRPPDS